MEDKRKIEILTMAVAILELDLNIVKGICDTIHRLHDLEKISGSEFGLIIDFISENKPNPYNDYKEFTQNPYWQVKKYPILIGYWWLSINEEPRTLKIRIDYLKKLISSIEAE